MKTNVEKVLERDQKLSELDDRAGKKVKHSFSYIQIVYKDFSIYYIYEI